MSRNGAARSLAIFLFWRASIQYLEMIRVFIYILLVPENYGACLFLLFLGLLALLSLIPGPLALQLFLLQEARD